MKFFDQVLTKHFGLPKAKINLIYYSIYYKKVGSIWNKGKHTFALITAEGSIHRGKGKSPHFGGAPTIGSESTIAAITAATNDKSVKVIILRVNSGGGSYIASDCIARAIRQAKKAGKKIVVSMSNVAASGGYYISLDADKIVALPATLTGSIGVIAGKFNFKPLMTKIGVTYDELSIHDNGRYWSAVHDYSETEAHVLTKFLDRVYSDFTQKVSAGRKLALEDVEKAAKGRVLPAKTAKELGLVDVLGGFMTAIGEAKSLIGLPPTAPIKLKIFPPREPLWKKLFKFPKNSREANLDGGVLAPIFSSIGAFFSLFTFVANIISMSEVKTLTNLMNGPVNIETQCAIIEDE